MEQKLEFIAKIMLATGSINYMATAIESVNADMKHVPDEKGYHKDGIVERDELLQEVTNGLYAIMEKLGDYMNGADCVSPVDERATLQAFEIVSGRNDNVED